jgi:hypothetical protein
MFVKTIKLLLLLMAVSGIIFPAYLPAVTKQAPCCSCCGGAVCGCGCNKADSLQPDLPGSHKTGASAPCDFNTCNPKTPSSTDKTFYVASSDNSLKKKLALGIKTNSPAESSCIPATVSPHGLTAAHLFHPPPLFLKHAALLL